MEKHLTNTQPRDSLQLGTPLEDESWKQCFEMVTGLVPHESLSETELEAFDEFLVGCDCHDADSSCSDPLTCSCRQRLPLAYDADHRLKWQYLVHANHQPPIVECGTLCNCNEFCQNRVVGNSTTEIAVNSLPSTLSLEVFATDRKGFALRTLQNIPAGTFVCEYAGELISLEEAAKRTKKYSDTFIFLVQEQSGSNSAPMRTCIDARNKGGLARFINHSCRPNLYMIPVRIDINLPRLACFSKQNIPSGQELTVDYAQQSPDETFSSSTLCACDSSNCRKYLPSQPDLFSLNINS